MNKDVETPHLFVYNNFEEVLIMDLVTIGKIINTFGIKGEVKVYSSTDFPTLRFKKGNKVYLFNEENKTYEKRIINKVRIEPDFIYISFDQLDDINKVLKYKNCLIQIEKEKQHALEEGSYYHYELIGCKVTYNNEVIGEVVGVTTNNAQDLLKIKKEDNSTFLYPFLFIFINKIDVEAKIIDLNPIEGLIP
jgi:16S rRNA processing protein RimM